MKKLKSILLTGLALAFTALGLTACVDDPDESNLYTSTAETIDSYLQKNEQLSSFYYILQRADKDRQMASYGRYTCFAPTNDAVQAYIDRLWDDPEGESQIEHNGMTEHSLEGLTDSLCNEIANYHLTNGTHTIMEMGGTGTTINTMLNYPFSTAVDSMGNTVINDKAAIVSSDNEVINGYVHVIDQVIPRSTRLVGDVVKRLGDEYSIYREAFTLCGFADILTGVKKMDGNKARQYTITDNKDTDTNKSSLYWPEECKLGYTVFAVSDADLAANNDIHSLQDLIQLANETYGNCQWYDYAREKGITVSTSDDYTSQWNALHMLLAYHILDVSMSKDQMVFEPQYNIAKADQTWNYNVNNGGQPYDYYETLLPNTLIKIWEPHPGRAQDRNLYINRHIAFNTLTDQIASLGSPGFHQVIDEGALVTREDITAFNGYIHPINKLLLYTKDVAKGVLHERLRIHCSSNLKEMINNGYRYMSMAEVGNLNGGGSGARVAFPLDFFDNVVSFTDANKFRYNVHGAYRLYQSDGFQGWGKYDLAIKLPHVPSGVYELRMFYSPMSHGGMMQFYVGKSPNPQEMEALDLPLDVRINASDPRIGLTPFYEEDDMGVSTDIALRNRGYMRTPLSFRGHPEKTDEDMEANNVRGDCADGSATLYRILGRVNIKQSEDTWLRYKSVAKNASDDLKWQYNFIELMPVDLLDGAQYPEDWY